MRSIELWRAIAHLRISSFRACLFETPRNDGGSKSLPQSWARFAPQKRWKIKTIGATDAVGLKVEPPVCGFMG
jgi:hypothetical protein